MLDQVNRRFLYGFLLVSGFAACSYDAPSVGNTTTSESSSSSSGMGGTGGDQSSSSSGNGGEGLIPLGGMGGFGVGGMLMTGGGGAGGAGTTSSSSSSSSGSSSGAGGSGSVADPIVSDCENGDCHTSPTLTICCKAKMSGGTNNCTQVSGVCLNPADYAMECDDKADCGDSAFCCMSGDRAECKTSCDGMVVCKTNADCPAEGTCSTADAPVRFCTTP